MGVDTLAAALVVCRQLASARAYGRAQLGQTDRLKLFSALKSGDRVLEIGPSANPIDAHDHRHWPPALNYTVIDTSETPLPIEHTCARFERVRGAWQTALPSLAATRTSEFDAVVVLLPSALYFSENESSLSRGLRTALRLQRPRAEWRAFAASAFTLLRPGGQLLTADVAAEFALTRLALPVPQWWPALRADVLEGAGFAVETVRAPQSPFDDAEVLLRATKPGSIAPCHTL
jgi:hypothetical protein